MLSLLAAAAAAGTGAADPIQFTDLGLRPYLFEIGGFQLRYYSLAYLAGILLAYWHLTKMVASHGSPMAQRHVDDLFFYCTLGVILGGRIGYVVFYRPDLLGTLDMFKLWEGGMSFHGGVIGVLIAITWVAWRGGLNWLRVCDYIAVNIPFGMLFGRLANFVNGELYGRPTDVPWAMVFPSDPLGLARHPSQLYQAALEGALLIAVLLPLFWYTRARYKPGLLVGLFTIGVAGARFVNEFFREPDAHLAYVVTDTGLSRGQWLSIPMILVGLAVIAYALTRRDAPTSRAASAA